MPANIHLLPPLLTPQTPPLSSQLNSPNEASVFSSPLLLCLLIALGLYLFWTSSASRFDEILHEDRHSEALAALMAIFTPTKSSWPSDILDATRRASASRLGHNLASSGSGPGSGKGEIRLGFSAVYEHILNGDLELQPTASVDLVKAILLERGGMEVDGWRIKVVVEWKWVWRISLWVMRGLRPRLVNLSELWNGDAQKTSHLLERALVPSPRPTYALDLLPAHQHNQFARQLHKMLRSGHPRSPDYGGDGEGETHAIVAFSTISTPSVLLSTITLCGLPFFLRTPPAQPTPVLLGLRRAIKSLSSVSTYPRTAAEKGGLVVKSVEDTSETYASVLAETIKQMEGDMDFRQGLVDELGVRGWKRGMFCLELEAALHKAGLMKRWEVLVGVY